MKSQDYDFFFFLLDLCERGNADESLWKKQAPSALVLGRIYFVFTVSFISSPALNHLIVSSDVLSGLWLLSGCKSL